MKAYVAASDACYEGYGAPEYVFLSRELADGFKAIHQDYEIFELDILSDLSTVPVNALQPQREFTKQEKRSAAIYSRLVTRYFFSAENIAARSASHDQKSDTIRFGRANV